jgi:hypothetical protein
MGKYIGSNSPYGLYEKQSLELVAGRTKFSLDYKVGYETSILVVYEIAGGSKILEPGVDYSLVDGGTAIQLTFETFDNDGTYTERLYVLYLGRQLSVPVPLEKKPLLVQFTNTTQTTIFITSDVHLTEHGIIVSKNGTQLSHGTDFTITTDGASIALAIAPVVEDRFDVHVFAGIQKLSLTAIDDDTITTEKLKQNSVATSKLDLSFTTFDNSNVAVTGSGAMSAVSTNIIEATHMVQGNPDSTNGAPVKVRVKFTTTLAGTANNKVRFALPSNLPTESTIIGGSVVIKTDDSIESGILSWGSANAVDVYRQFGVNYTLGVVTIEASFEYIAKR